MKLSPDQQEVQDAILDGKSIIVLGGAGVGKSHCVKDSLKRAKPKGLALCASTASSAVNFDKRAVTANSLFGLGRRIFTPNAVREKPNFKKLPILRNINTLVIEEMPFLRRDLIDKMDYSMRYAKDCDEPWGGIQVIGLGDFGQFNPVLSEADAGIFNMYYDSAWCFNSTSFQHLQPIFLETVHRNVDPKQQRLIQSIRDYDKYVSAAVERLWEWSTPYDQDDFSKVTLCAYKKDMVKINNLAFAKNPNEEVLYTGEFKGKREFMTEYDSAEFIRLKKGCLVRVTANSPTKGSFYNGMVGVVEELLEDSVVIKVTEDWGDRLVVIPQVEHKSIGYVAKGDKIGTKTYGTFKQIPLNLTYATTIHSSQGLTLQSANIHLGDRPFYGAKHLLYVAITRVRDLRTISYVVKPRLEDVIIDQEVVEFYKKHGVR